MILEDGLKQTWSKSGQYIKQTLNSASKVLKEWIYYDDAGKRLYQWRAWAGGKPTDFEQYTSAVLKDLDQWVDSGGRWVSQKLDSAGKKPLGAIPPRLRRGEDQSRNDYRLPFVVVVASLFRDGEIVGCHFLRRGVVGRNLFESVRACVVRGGRVAIGIMPLANYFLHEVSSWLDLCSPKSGPIDRSRLGAVVS